MLSLFLMIWIAYQAPQTFPDSIQNLIEKTSDDSLKSVLYYDLGKHYYGTDQDTAIYFAQLSISLAEKLGLDKVKGNALNIMGVAQFIRSDYEDALQAHLQALKIRESLRDSVGMLESNLNLGNVYYRNGEMGKAAEMYEKALVYGLATKNLRGQSLIYNNLGNYYSDRWVESKQQEDYVLALDYLQKSLKIKEDLKDNRGLVKTLTQLAQLNMSDRAKAGDYLLRALALSKENQDIENKIVVLNELSNYYLQINDFAKVRTYGLQAYQIAKDANSDFYISVSADYLVKAAEGLGDFKNAYEYLLVKKTADEALFNESRAKVRDELLIQYETEKKELENHRLTQEQQYLDLSIQRRNELLIGTSLLFLVLLALFIVQRKNHRNLKLTHDQLEASNRLTQEQNLQIQEQANHLSEANQNLTKANQFRDKIFSVISHDLRAPFSSLHSIIQLWDKKMLTEEELHEVMPLIAHDTHRLSQLLNNLLMWSREQMGMDEVQLSTFGLGDLVDETAELLSPQIKHKKIQFTHQQMGVEVTSDRERLSFIIRNILMNAIKFTEDGGKVTVDYPSEKSIRIQDSGRGMPPEMLAKLFSSRINSEKGTSGESGTGIGLMLSKEFAESLGAKILVESEVGVGTTFQVILS